MNFAHVHLMLNHIPVVGIPIAIAFLAYGIYVNNLPTQRFAYFVLIGLALIALPVYFTGESAEEVVEHLSGINESFVESHEDAALYSLILTLITGTVAFIAAWFQKDANKNRLLRFAVLGVAIFAISSLLYTANLGGKIRRPELQSGTIIQ